MKAYGRETAGKTEGRRNFVESYQYTEMDGSKRTRIRFNVKGPRGTVRVWAEVSDKMASNEFVYIICQDMKTGRIITIEDNRSRLDAEMASGGSSESTNAIQRLLGGGR